MNPDYSVTLFPPGQHPALQPPRGRKRKAPRQVGNVVSIRPAPETTADIVRDVAARRHSQEAEITARLQAAVAALDERHRDHAQTAVAIGYAMQRPILDDWLEIGRRMLAAKGGRR